MKTLFFLFCILFAASLAFAMEQSESTLNCHCFKNRTFDPRHKYAADNYLLTTSFNSFIAKNFTLSKREIVMMLMKGSVGPEDLLIGLYLAREAEVDLKSLLAILDNGGTWELIISQASLQKTGASGEFLKSLKTVINDKKLTVEIITDQLLKENFVISESAIKSLRREGASGRELTLIYLLEKFGGRNKSAADILAMKTKEKKSWGEIALFFGLSPKGTGKLLSKEQ
jgi:hypothetical protein